MTLRFSLLPTALAGLLLVTAASAQSIEAIGGTLRDATSLDLRTRSVAPAASNLLAPCSGGAVDQNTGTSGFNNGNTAQAGGPQELGQSFTATCDGSFDGVVLYVATFNAATVGTTVTGTLYVYNGDGTAGTLASATRFAFTLPTATATINTRFVALDAVPVTTGGVYTFFVDMDAGSDLVLVGNTANPYAGGNVYVSTSTGPTPSGPAVGIDLRFQAFLDAEATVSTPTVFDGAGYRLFSAPVFGVTVDDLAGENLVQGVPAGTPASRYPAQYPEQGDNLLPTYNGDGTFSGPSSTGDLLEPGEGFFWYFYDQTTPPPTTTPTGTSQSFELSGYTLSATGADYEFNTFGFDQQVGFATHADAYYMLGNPYTDPFTLSGVSVDNGMLGTVFSVWDPSQGTFGSYVNLGPTDTVAPWQGFFAQATGAVNPTFTYDNTEINDSTATPTFYGRQGAVADAGVRFTLDGQTAAGHTRDLAATVRFLDDAEAGFDRHDGGKLLPPGGAYALLAPVGGDAGELERLSVNSLPQSLTEAVAVPLAFLATDGGTFTVSWESTLGTDRRATLRDLVTGAVVDLATATEYTFTADATDWTARFVLDVMPGNVVAGESGPAAVRVGAFAPNPATGATRLTLAVDVAQTVRATVVDALGREVAVVFDAAVAPGADVTLTVETARLPAGTYVVRVAGETFAEARRLTVVR